MTRQHSILIQPHDEFVYYHKEFQYREDIFQAPVEYLIEKYAKKRLKNLKQRSTYFRT